MSDTIKTWSIKSNHTRMERARLLAELALADFANDRFGMTERVAFRIAEALEKYELADAGARALNAHTSNPACEKRASLTASTCGIEAQGANE